MHKPLIFPSLSAHDPKLKKIIKELNPLCQGYHLDVMDGEFVPQKAWDAAAINAIEKETLHQLWIHLMVSDPYPWLEKLTVQGFSIISIHIESTKEIQKSILYMKKKKWLPSIAVSPKTNLDEVFPFLDEANQVLLMSVQPGFSGQEFLPETIERLGKLVGYRETSGLNFKIGIDGGINKENIGLLAERGVDTFGVSSAIFDEPDPVKALQELQKIVANPKA